MATKKKMLMSAAGSAGGGGGLDIDEVFSTYLYEGTGATQSINNGIALGNFGRGTSTLFSGTGASSDFLKRTSDLTGNSDGKTLTLSAWIFPEEDTNLNFFACANSGGSDRMLFSLDDTQKLALNLHNSSGTRLLNLESRATQGAGLPLKAWSHVLISVDLSDTSKRHLYINDAIPSHVDWDAYTNGTVDFTQPKWGVGGSPTSGSGTERMAHLYFDYTYRDLSVASNRRHFIDANGGSTSTSTQSALNPIVYMPLTEDYSTGKNLGTGGDFTVNGSPTVLDTGTEYEDGYGEGGLVWIKPRNQVKNHSLFDTVSGPDKYLSSNQNTEQLTDANINFAFNANGWGMKNAYSTLNTLHEPIVSWTFRKAPKFFDVVTYTGNSTNRTISHNLGSVPGMIIVKRRDNPDNWFVYHRGTGATKGLMLNQSYAAFTGGYWQNTNPTATEFSIFDDDTVNANGGTYIAYLFAHNDGDGTFGPDGDQDVIKCGSYTGNGNDNGPEIDLGFEPQWVMVKNTTDADSWYMFDVMRGMVVAGTDDAAIRADSSLQETGTSGERAISPTPTGFKVTTNQGWINGNNTNLIYIAIRRGPLAVPEDATKVFDVYEGSDAYPTVITTGFTVDFLLGADRSGSSNNFISGSRLTGSKSLKTNSTDSQGNALFSTSPNACFMRNDGILPSTFGQSDTVYYSWKRAPGYFDAVAYTGNDTARTIQHNLGVVPEMIWVKSRSASSNWSVLHSGLNTAGNEYIRLDRTNAKDSNVQIWNGTVPTDTVFSIGTSDQVNHSYQSATYIAYLFASAPGVSKVGSFTATGSDVSVDCGFTSGARFVLIKRTNSADDWFVFDTARGIAAGNDKRLKLNDTSAEATSDNIDPYSAGFTMTSGILGSAGNTFIFYAIA